MPVQPVERKLAAIFAADIAGYSRLMARDEVGTLARLKACRAIIDDLIASHRGRIFNTAGDSVVADFASAVDAVQCAVAVQAAIATENAERCRPTSRCSSALACMSAMSWSTATTCSATGSTSPPGWKPRRARRDLRLGCSARSHRQQAAAGLRRSRRSAGQEHRAGDPGVPGASRNTGASTRRRAAAARQAVDRGIAVPEHERRPGAGIFRRRHGRGDHHRAVAASAGCSSSPAIRASPTRAKRSM